MDLVFNQSILNQLALLDHARTSKFGYTYSAGLVLNPFRLDLSHL